MSMLHTSPSKPARQEQEKLSTDPRSEHAAPLAHGELSHSSTSTWQFPASRSNGLVLSMMLHCGSYSSMNE
jgi:hypothetical protein